MNNSMINLWGRVKIQCLNHDEPLPMEIIENTELIKTPFYACKNYLLPGKETEESCSNRLNLDDYQGVVLKFIDKVADSEIGTDFTNYKFAYKGARQKIEAKVIRFTDDEIIIGIKNLTVLGK